MKRDKEIYKVTLVGSVVNIILLLLKFLAGILGRSSAMIADAVHSLSDFVTDIIVLVNVRKMLDEHAVRATIDQRNEKTGRKIRDAEVSKIPFILIVGEKEATDGTVSVREHGAGDLGVMSIADFVKVVNDKIDMELHK